MLKVTQVKFVVGLGGTKSVEPSAVLSAAMIGKNKEKTLALREMGETSRPDLGSQE